MIFFLIACGNDQETTTKDLVDQPIDEARDLIKDPISEANTSVAEPVISQARDIVVAPIAEARDIIAVPISEAQDAINQLIPTPSPQVSNPATIMTITADIQSLRDTQKLDLGTSENNFVYEGATLSSDEAINVIKTYLLSNFCGDYLSSNDVWGHDFDQNSSIWTLVKKDNNTTLSWILNDQTLEIVSSQGLC